MPTDVPFINGPGPLKLDSLDAMEIAMEQSLTNLNLPSRDEVARVAERMTNIEMRLDDLDAKGRVRQLVRDELESQ